MDAPPFFCVVWYGWSVLSWWALVFQLQSIPTLTHINEDQWKTLIVEKHCIYILHYILSRMCHVYRYRIKRWNEKRSTREREKYYNLICFWLSGTHRQLSSVHKAILWLYVFKKRKRLSQMRNETRSSLAPLLRALKRLQYGLLQAILSCLNPPRSREVWMHPHSFAWFGMVEASFPDELWYSNFRVFQL